MVEQLNGTRITLDDHPEAVLDDEAAAGPVPQEPAEANRITAATTVAPSADRAAGVAPRPPATSATVEPELYLYPEDLADFDEFDFGGATFRGKARQQRSDAAAANKASDVTDYRPLSARDLPRHQQPGMRFIEPRPLPLRGQRAAPKPLPPIPRVGDGQHIEARALLRTRRNLRRNTDPK